MPAPRTREIQAEEVLRDKAEYIAAKLTDLRASQAAKERAALKVEWDRQALNLYYEERLNCLSDAVSSGEMTEAEARAWDKTIRKDLFGDV